jgi:hypothetical protein
MAVMHATKEQSMQNETLTTIDETSLSNVHGGWVGAAAGIAAGIGLGIFNAGHDKGISKRGQGQPSDSLKDLVDPKNPANLMYASPALGLGRVIYKAGEYVGRK